MPLPQDHPEYDYLQSKLDELRQRIAEKKKKATQVFAEIIQYIDTNLGVDLPEALREELRQIKAMLAQEKQSKVQSQQGVETEAAAVTTEDILKAINAMLSASDQPFNEEQKTAIHTEKMREELRKIIAVRMATEASQLPKQLRDIAQAQDFMGLLNSSQIRPICQQLGGCENVFDQAMTVVESRASMLDKVTSIGEKISSDFASPDQTPDQKEMHEGSQR
jgi:hypothetical protein